MVVKNLKYDSTASLVMQTSGYRRKSVIACSKTTRNLHLKVSKFSWSQNELVFIAVGFCCSKPNNFLYYVSAKEKTVSYIVCGQIGQKLSVRIAPQKRYVRQVTVKVPMDRAVFDDLFGGVSRGRTRFDVTVADLDSILPQGWCERTFKTNTKCVVSREEPITIRFASRRNSVTTIPSALAAVVCAWGETCLV